MFAKPYKLRQTSTLKNSEKKSLVQRLCDEYQYVDAEKLKALVPVKSAAYWLKVQLYSGHLASVLVVDSSPLFMDIDNRLVPTVVALWRVPDMLPMITIHEPVLDKVREGASLYVPGVVTHVLPCFPPGAFVAARTTSNAAAALVARAKISSGDLLLRTNGVCVDTLQVYGDHLCKDRKFERLERPLVQISYDVTSKIAEDVGRVLNLKTETEDTMKKDSKEWPELWSPSSSTEKASPEGTSLQATPASDTTSAIAADTASADAPAVPGESNQSPLLTFPVLKEMASVEKIAAAADVSGAGAEGEGREEEVPDYMDGLLRWALLAFIKMDGRNVDLPLKTNLLYKNHMIPLCPPNRQIDVKKSTYRKLSKFLEAMQQEGLVQVEEMESGVWAITALSIDHEAVREFRVTPELRARRDKPLPPAEYQPPVVRDLYCLTGPVMPLFPKHKRGEALTAAEVREAAVRHVRERGLACEHRKGAVTLDSTLAEILGLQEREEVQWEGVVTGVLARLTAAAELRFPTGPPRLLKQRLPPITMQIANRAGNKKVTLVSNLGLYGFELSKLSKSWQALAGAACSVTRSAAKTDQLLLQGDQTHFVAKTLIEKYGLPKKFVEGADKALSKKKG